MKLHKNASLTLKQRQQVKDLYASGKYSQQSLAQQFGTTRRTIAKWINRSDIQDASSAPKQAHRSIGADFEQAVKAYREDPLTRHHGKVRMAEALKKNYSCSNASNVYLVLKKLKLNTAKSIRPKTKNHIPVGRHRTQMDIQQLPAVAGNSGFEYKISIIHLSTRIKYSEIHDNCESQTIAEVYQRACDHPQRRPLPPFS